MVRINLRILSVYDMWVHTWRGGSFCTWFVPPPFSLSNLNEASNTRQRLNDSVHVLPSLWTFDWSYKSESEKEETQECDSYFPSARCWNLSRENFLFICVNKKKKRWRIARLFLSPFNRYREIHHDRWNIFHRSLVALSSALKHFMCF